MTVKREFYNDEFYHVYNRGVDKRNIFKDYFDEQRFVRGSRIFRFLADPRGRSIERGDFAMDGEKLVDSVAYCLMPNHYHMLIKQCMEGGVSKYLSKLNNGYTKYFNIRWDRSGHLFEYRFKSEHISSDAYYLQVTHYIHANPLVFFQKDWKEKGLKDPNTALDFLLDYGKSSLGMYLDHGAELIKIGGDDLIHPMSGDEYRAAFLGYISGRQPAGLA